MAPALPRRQLADVAAEQMRALIISGGLQPGASVRPEYVGELLGISTTPAREALQRLRAEGFLDLAPGRGFTVAPLTGDDIRDLFTAQGLLAGELAARAAAHASEDSVAELEALHHELIAAAERANTAGLENKNHEFHRAINRMAASRKIQWGLSLFSRYVPREFYGSIPGWSAATVEDHGAILEALRAGDADSARRLMVEHISHAGELLATHFDARRGSDADEASA